MACGILGVFVVLRGLSFMSDALSHCVVPGVVVGVLTQASRELWGAVAAVSSAWAMALLMRRRMLTSDAAIAVVFTGTFALGLALISLTRNYLNDLTEILFGAILAVGPNDLLASGGVAAVVLVAVVLLYWPLVLVSFDPVAARSQGLPVDWLDVVFYGLLALALVSGMIAVGTTLVTGLLIVPAATARLLAHRVVTQIVVSALTGCLASWLRLYASYYFGVAAGGAIIIAAALLFAVALLAAPIRRIVGLIARPRLLAKAATA